MTGLESSIEQELRAFEAGELDPAKFPHSEHLRLGYEMLGRHSFSGAVERFSRGLKLLAAKAGRPRIYHETITIAFLALINERRARGGQESWLEFQKTNPDLFDKRCLERCTARNSWRPILLTNVLFFLKERRFTNRRFKRSAICKSPLLGA